MRHGGRIPYLYHFSKGRTHGTAVQRSYGRKEYEKGHHTGRGKGCRGFAVHGVPCLSLIHIFYDIGSLVDWPYGLEY